MRILLNGEPQELREDATVVDAVEASGVSASGAGVAVAVDGEVVPRGSWAGRTLNEDARVEVLQAVQGG